MYQNTNMKGIAFIIFTLSTFCAECLGKALPSHSGFSERELHLLERMEDNFDNLNWSWCDFVNNVEVHFHYNAAIDCLETQTCNDTDSSKDKIDFMREVINKLGKASCYICSLEEALSTNKAKFENRNNIPVCLMSSFVENGLDSSPIFINVKDLQLNLKSLYTKLTSHRIITQQPICVNVTVSETNMVPLIQRYIVDAKVLLNTLMMEYKVETEVLDRPAFG